MLIYCYSTHIIVIGAHSISSCYCVSFAQHKCFIDKKKKRKKDVDRLPRMHITADLRRENERVHLIHAMVLQYVVLFFLDI